MIMGINGKVNFSLKEKTEGDVKEVVMTFKIFNRGLSSQGWKTTISQGVKESTLKVQYFRNYRRLLPFVKS